MPIEDETGASVSEVKWHRGDGRYLTREECLSKVVEVRERRGKPATLTEEETLLGLEDCHELLSREMREIHAEVVAINSKSGVRRDSRYRRWRRPSRFK